MNIKVEMYTKTYCPFCVKAKNLLALKGLTPEEYNIERDIDRLKEMLERSNGAKTVPQIFINDIYIGGYDKLEKLEKENKLDDIINKK